MIENIEQAKKHLKEIIDFYKLNDENNYDYTDKDLISIRIVLKEIERLNNIINEFNSSYSKIIKECEEMINDRFYMNDNAIKYHANRIRDIAKYYIEEPKWQELKGVDKE